ncbi:MAG: TIGR01212 family radical SAM protein, partial [Candidatus Omnitrophota bacterium]
MQRYYYSFNEYLQDKFKTRVQRISLNAGFGCPNRDGSLSAEGCAFCNEDGFVNFPDTRYSLNEQIERSMKYFKKRFKVEKFIAYFQNASNTYAEIANLK